MKLSKKQALLLVGHGSRVDGFDASMRKLSTALQKKQKVGWVTCAFLETALPSIPEAIDAAVSKGFSEIRVVPFFVHLGNHVLRDIPGILEHAKRKHPSIRFVLCPYLGYDELMLRLVQKRASQIEKKF